MPSSLADNHSRLTLVSLLGLALVIGWGLTVALTPHASGKGSVGSAPESMLYSLALTLAIAEAACLASPRAVFRWLFFSLATVNVLVAVGLVLLVLNFGSFAHLPPPDLRFFLSIFPLCAVILLLVIYFAGRRPAA